MDRTRLISQLKQAEGCRLTAYKDSLGFWTIGYGHLLAAGRDWAGYTITQEQADALLATDLSIAADLAQTLLEWPSLDTDARQNAVAELVFNMGLSKWKKFAHCRLAITQKDWQTAKDQLLNSLWATQVGQHRSARIADQLSTGEFV